MATHKQSCLKNWLSMAPEAWYHVDPMNVEMLGQALARQVPISGPGSIGAPSGIMQAMCWISR